MPMDFIEHLPELALALFGLFAAIAAMTPTKADDDIVDRIRNLIRGSK